MLEQAMVTFMSSGVPEEAQTVPGVRVCGPHHTRYDSEDSHCNSEIFANLRKAFVSSSNSVVCRGAGGAPQRAR